MDTRTIKLKLLTQQELVKISTNVRTFGEFKKLEEVAALGIDWENSLLIDRASSTSFNLDEAVMPSVDSIMFVTPTKTKSGALSYKEAKEIIKEYKANGGYVPFNYTQATTKELNDFIVKNGLQENEILDDVTPEVEETIIEDMLSLVEKLKDSLTKLSSVSSKNVQPLKASLQDYEHSLAEFVTKEQLQIEAEHLAKILG